MTRALSLLFIFVSSHAYADYIWIPPSQKAMIKRAELVVIGKFISSENKTATFEVEKFIHNGKGTLRREITIRRKLVDACRGSHTFKNKKGDRILLFLVAYKTDYALCEDPSGAFSINKDKVLWFDKESHDKTKFSIGYKAPSLTDISQVVKIIQEEKKLQNP